ncbi:30S ribosomal protein S14 [Natrialba sp. INN-245]|uniref:30S ribosomal protein S14 n=1 Tax=Natrialba sp. INN-245 TaxID=2690967 RepID=UPI001312F2DB|nr:30S ribosomal protein S14 [Natrialba sp. INN-245]
MSPPDEPTGGDDEPTTDEESGADAERTGHTHVCRVTGREDGLVGKYDIWLSRQSFREMARDMGFRKYK